MTAPTRRARLTVALLLVAAWLAVAGFGGPTFGTISEVSSNDQATFLPADAESTRAAERMAQLSPDELLPALVVADFPTPLTDANLAALTPLAEDINAVDGVVYTMPPAPSTDRLAVQIIALIDPAGSDPTVVVEKLREALPDDGTFHVTGPAGIAADLAGAFAGIDGLLLIVALVVVLVILVVVYRSVLLPIIVILTAMTALCGAILAVYWLARAGWITLNGQAQGILSILVIGATTDYALLLVARMREELLRREHVAAALANAVRGSFGAIAASAATVAIALLCLLFSELNSNRSLGPIAATGILFAFAASLTLLPALLLLLGRAAYWPARPRYQDASSTAGATSAHPGWARVANLVAAAPRRVWVLTALALVAGAAFVPTLKADGVPTTEVILGTTDAKAGQEILNTHFEAGDGSPTTVIVPVALADQVMGILGAHDGVAQAMASRPAGQQAGEDETYLMATLSDPPDSATAEATVTDLRTQLHDLDPNILVGGPTATAIDSNLTAERDLKVIIPLVLLVVLAILIVLLRAILLPVLLIAATTLSFGTAIGVAALVFNHVLGFPGADPSVPLYGFVFLVALGIDYTIFLMTRAREETPALGTRRAVLESLTVTGGVITSAGVVLAATFAALVVIPLMFMVQLAFIVAFGVLIDTLIVRTLLIPGLVGDLGGRVWWPWQRRIEPGDLAVELDVTK